MKKEKLSRFKLLGLSVLGAYAIAGCPSQAVGDRPVTRDVVVQETVALSEEPVVVPATDESEANAELAADAVAFEVCAAVDSWQRPSEAEQAKHLSGDPRYAAALAGDPLKASDSQFWDTQIVSFTTYGLSARMEPVNLTGLWTVADELWSCYETEDAMAINAGDRAEAWLLNQRISSLEWRGDRYVMTLEPADTGMQVVQFERVDGAGSLPLEAISTAGEPIVVVSGDWQE